jgi:hypothetical protein
VGSINILSGSLSTLFIARGREFLSSKTSPGRRMFRRRVVSGPRRASGGWSSLYTWVACGASPTETKKYRNSSKRRLTLGRGMRRNSDNTAIVPNKRDHDDEHGSNGKQEHEGRFRRSFRSCRSVSTPVVSQPAASYGQSAGLYRTRRHKGHLIF